MSQAAAYQESEANTETNQMEEKATRFLLDLTRLSLLHGVGITGSPELFIMESDDYERSYKIDGQSKLSFD